MRRPNFLWITCEDMSMSLRCFGDEYAVTPNLDRLAEQGVRFTNVFTHAPVCAPSRSGVITGMYPTSIGSHNMRCEAVPPSFVRCFTEYLRAVGYYCTNNSKTDYNFRQHPSVHLAQDAPFTAWDESSVRAHWRNRPPDTPFFAVFNILSTHESQLRSTDPELLKEIGQLPAHFRHDPAKATLPPYYPDTPAVRRDWAQHYDTVTLMDGRAGEILRQLEQDGLAEDTIVWFWSDHGVGLPRAKRWVYDSGIHVPLIIRVPERFREWAMPDAPERLRPGTINDDLIAFVDFAPTVLSLAGIRPPRHMQGQAFMGRYRRSPRQYVYAARDRMDETYDIIRAVRDRRFKYIRNFMHHLPYAQEVEYAELTPTLQEMRRLHAEGKLDSVQSLFFLPRKPVEELYDTQSDPHEVHNLADDPRYRDVLERMRRQLLRWMEETGDVGLIPEPELDAMMRPDDVSFQTAPPAVSVREQGEGRFVVDLRSQTDGASVAYRVGESRWKLWTKPILLEQGEVLTAKACRLGCPDSEEVTYRVGDPPPEPPKPVRQPPDWHQHIKRSGLVRRLLAIKSLDGRQGTEILPQYMKALRDRQCAVRYWAVVGLHNSCQNGSERERVLPSVRRLLTDSCPSVKVAAIHLLYDWGETDMVKQPLLPLLEHPSEHVRLFALNMMRHCRGLARDLQPVLRKALEDPREDVRKAARTLLRHLGDAVSPR